jgi:predicted nucleic acid-binding protein
LSEAYGRSRAVLDADIIYSRVLHEFMGRVARDLRLLTLFWSDELLAETRESLIEKKGLTPDVAQRWVDRLPQNFPTGQVQIGKTLDTIDLTSLTSDPGDHHVCALAIASNADYLFTHDRGYLRDGLSSYGVQVITPDEFLTAAFDSDTQGILEILELQATDWGGGRPTEELLDAIERAGAPRFADKARHSLNF